MLINIVTNAIDVITLRAGPKNEGCSETGSHDNILRVPLVYLINGYSMLCVDINQKRETKT